MKKLLLLLLLATPAYGQYPVTWTPYGYRPTVTPYSPSGLYELKWVPSPYPGYLQLVMVPVKISLTKLY